MTSAMSVALENARLFDETQRLLKETEQRAAELDTVNAVSTALVSELDLGTLINLVGEQIRSIFQTDIAYVALLDKEKDTINFPYQYGEHLDPLQLITSRIIQSGKPIYNREMECNAGTGCNAGRQAARSNSAAASYICKRTCS
jgi:GAF domain-containing protein